MVVAEYSNVFIFAILCRMPKEQRWGGDKQVVELKEKQFVQERKSEKSLPV